MGSGGCRTDELLSVVLGSTKGGVGMAFISCPAEAERVN